MPPGRNQTQTLSSKKKPWMVGNPRLRRVGSFPEQLYVPVVIAVRETSRHPQLLKPTIFGEVKVAVLGHIDLFVRCVHWRAHDPFVKPGWERSATPSGIPYTDRSRKPAAQVVKNRCRVYLDLLGPRLQLRVPCWNSQIQTQCLGCFEAFFLGLRKLFANNAFKVNLK